MRRCKGFILFFFLISGFRSLFSQGEIVLKVQPDTNIIRIGEQINLSVLLKHPDNLTVDFPFIPDIIDPGLEILENSGVDTISSKNNIISLQQKLTLTSFDTGFYQIQPLPFEISFGDKKDTLYSRMVPLMVLTLPLDTTNNIFDIKSQFPMKFHISEISNSYLIIIFFAVMLILGLTLLYIERKNKKETGPVIKKPQIPAHIIALKELDALKSEKLWQQNKLKEYYSRLTEIIRNYIELRFNVMALEQTSSEIIAEFREKRLIEYELNEQLYNLLSLADLVKFAKGTALPDENEKNMESAYDFVRKTRIVHTLQSENTKEENETVKVEPENEIKKDA